jgi:hypothetical protein
MKPITLDALARIIDTRKRIDRLTWKARSEVIRAQLVAMRGTVPA